MKAPRGQAFNKKLSREKKKAAVESSADESIAPPSTHICPGIVMLKLFVIIFVQII